MKDFLLKLPFCFSLVASTIGASVVSSIIEPYCNNVLSVLFFVLSFMFIHYIINELIFNRWVLKNVVENNTPVFTYDNHKGYIGYPKEIPKEFLWDAVEKIEIVTTDEGPWEEDLWWIFFIREAEEPLLIPSGAKGIDKIFEVFEDKFENIDNEMIINAMGSSVNARFNLWNKQQ